MSEVREAYLSGKAVGACQGGRAMKEACARDYKEAVDNSTQQLKAEIAAVCEWFCTAPPVDLPKNLDTLIIKLRQLSAV